MTPAVISILTNGLTCGAGGPDIPTSCTNGSLLVAGPFSLFCTEMLEAYPPDGGGHVITPGSVVANNIIGHTVHQPVKSPDMVPFNTQFQYRKSPVQIKFKLGKIDITREYMMTTHKRDTHIRIFNILNTTNKNIKLMVVNITRMASKLRAYVINFQKKS